MISRPQAPKLPEAAWINQPAPQPFIHPIRQGDEFSSRRKSIGENARRSWPFRATKLARDALARPWYLAPPIHDAALEATMYPTICSFHTSGVVIAEGLA